jgi:DNA polymerase-3 subunit chi
MTKVDFYTGLPNKLHTVCQLSNKAMQSGIRTVISVPDETMLDALDKLLWRYPPVSFTPHCRSDDALAEQTPILLHHGNDPLLGHHLLISLHPDPMPFFSRFERVIELVGTDEEDINLGRLRYKFYRDRGYELSNTDLSKGVSK